MVSLNWAVRALTATVPLPEPVVRAVTDFVHRAVDHYFTVPVQHDRVNWNHYTHQQLAAMLQQDASQGQADEIGSAYHEISSELQQHTDQISRQAAGAEWAGEAAGVSLGRVLSVRDNVAELGGYSSHLGTSVQLAADALGHAQQKMPPPPGDHGQAIRTGAAAGGAAGAVAGIFGVAVGSLAGAASSIVLTSVEDAMAKRDAVRVMQAYEQALISAAPDPVHVRQPGQTGRTDAERHANYPGVDATTVAGAPPSCPGAGGPLPGVDEVWSPGPSGGGPQPGPIPATSSGTPPFGGTSTVTSGASAPSAAFADVPFDGRTGGTPQPWDELTGRGSAGSLLGGGGAFAGGAAGRGSGGSRGPGASGGAADGEAGRAARGAGRGERAAAGARAGSSNPGAPGAGGRGVRDEDDLEHTSKYPNGQRLFDLDEQPIMPVIGI